MSEQFGKVIRLIIRERFGEVVEAVVDFLHKNGSSSLYHMAKFSGLPLSLIKPSLYYLLRYNLVSTKEKFNTLLYTLLSENIIVMLRYPLYTSIINRKFGMEMEILVDEIFMKGCMNDEDLIKTVKERLIKAALSVDAPLLKERFNSLKLAKYLIEFNYRTESQEKEGIESKVKKEELSVKYWTVNFDRFNQDLRDELIVSAFENRIDNNAAIIIKTFINQMYVRTSPWAPVSNPVPLLEVKDLIKNINAHSDLMKYFDQYITILEQDKSQFLVKIGGGSGGSYQLCLKRIYTNFAYEICEKYILERFGDKSARIFSLARTENRIEVEQIEKTVIMPSKEAQTLAYKLLEENFLCKENLKSTAKSNKVFTLFYVQQDQLFRGMIQLCYQFLSNIMIKRMHLKTSNEFLLSKKKKTEALLLILKSQGASDEELEKFAEKITPQQRETIEKIEESISKLNELEFDIVKTLFYFDINIQYS